MERAQTVHLVWIIVILALSVIGLAALRLGTDDAVKDILNFAVALASLLLALVAIVQALIAGGDLGERLADIKSAIRDIAEPAKQLKAAADIIGSHVESIQEETKKMVDLRLSQVDDDIKGQPFEIPNKTAGRGFDNSLLERLHGQGRLALYCIERSFNTKKSYMPGEDVGPNVKFWAGGFANALASSGVIGLRVDPARGTYVDNLGPLGWLSARGDEILADEDIKIGRQLI